MAPVLRVPGPLTLCRVALATLTLAFAAPPARADFSGGVITLAVDATEAPRKILHAKLTIPVEPGTLTLVYPKWIPGEHGPTGPLTDVAGLRFMAAGKPLRWERDLVDMHAVSCVVPEGVVDALEMVQVEHEKAERDRVTCGDPHLLPEELLEVAAVGEPGKRIR